MSKKTNKKNAVKRTFVIGVTGHRDIDPSDKEISRIVADECKALLKSYGNRDYIILSGLAEGADRLVARVAMRVLKARLIAVLAVPEENFRMDFGTPQSKRAFQTLVKRAEYVITAPLLSKNAWRDYTSSRNHQYAWEGAFLAQNSHVLFALWDGKPARGVGGTGSVVNWFIKQKVPKKYLKDSSSLAKRVGLKNVDKSTNRFLVHFILQ